MVRAVVCLIVTRPEGTRSRARQTADWHTRQRGRLKVGKRKDVGTDSRLQLTGPPRSSSRWVSRGSMRSLQTIFQDGPSLIIQIPQQFSRLGSAENIGFLRGPDPKHVPIPQNGHGIEGESF